MSDLEDLRALAPRIPQARRRMLDNLPGYPTTSTDTPSRGAGTEGGRTAALALRNTMRDDVALRDLNHLNHLEHTIRTNIEQGRPATRQITQLAVILNRWAPTNRMVDGLRASGNDTGDGWCKSHWRVGSCFPPKNPGGKLCRWCLDWVRALNDPDGEWAMTVEMPPLNMVEAHAQGRRVDGLLPPRRKQQR